MGKRKEESITGTKNSLAKVNLFLEVVSPRKDGFHNIKSILTEIHLADTFIFRLTEGDNIKCFCSSKELNEEDNLVLKIASFLKDKYKIKNGLDIVLEKNIPISAGLGGGSSNAASTIKICDELWDLQLSKGEMHKIAARFGSDINFFLEGGVAYLTGRGERVSNIPSMLEVKNLLLVNPYIKISSREAYSWVKVEAEKREKLERIKKAIARNNIPILCQNMYNSLEDGVFLRYPVIKEIKEKMLDFGAVGSLMSGSGATVFGIFDSKDEIKSAENYFKGLDFWTYRTGIDT